MESALSNQKSLWQRLVDGALPQSCLLCATRSGKAILCAPCADSLPLHAGPCCPVCAQPSPGAAICGECRSNAPHFDATYARYRYAFPLDRLIQEFKYTQRLALSRLLGAAPSYLNETLEAVIAVPASPAHGRERGFNPALELAKPIAQALGLPLLRAACTRPFDAPAQATLPWKERQANIRNAFVCHADLSNMRILVVDDVMTTGATLNELARILKRNGAASVTNYVVARAIAD